MLIFAASVVGFLLCLLWHSALTSGDAWHSHWVTILKDLEAVAWGERKLLRDDGGSRPSARRVARWTAALFTIIWFAMAVFSVVLFASTGPDNFKPETNIALERAALDRWNNGDPGGYLDTYAPEVSYFDPTTEKRIDGIDAMRAYYALLKGKIHSDRYEMRNVSVQRHGDAVALSYNLYNFGVAFEEGRGPQPTLELHQNLRARERRLEDCA